MSAALICSPVFGADLVPGAGGDDRQSGEADDDDRVDEGLCHRHQALADRVRGLGGGRGDRGRTESRFVREQTAVDARLDDR